MWAPGGGRAAGINQKLEVLLPSWGALRDGCAPPPPQPDIHWELYFLNVYPTHVTGFLGTLYK